MYYIRKRILRFFYKLIKSNPNKMSMVSYWKFKDSVMAKVMVGKDGATVMQMEGEKEIFPGFPRAHSLFGSLSPLKHQIKNQIFNESWDKLENGVPHEVIIVDIKEKITTGLQEYMDKCQYDMIPPTKMVKPVRELWRAFTVLEVKYPKVKLLKEALTFIMQEDDAYRFRLQWVSSIFQPHWYSRDPVKLFKLALEELEHGEVVGDMKAKQRLLKRILLLILEDEKINQMFREFVKEVDWKKLKLSRADKYHFRGKYFKVDFDKFSY